jgi:hypothetical protein
MCLYVPICAYMCLYVPICAYMCLYVPICVWVWVCVRAQINKVCVNVKGYVYACVCNWNNGTHLLNLLIYYMQLLELSKR